ncbi:MAG: formate dehydrogenase accessory sulfurtransferase FdhD [Porticoccaceae bacterium]|nr:formate dehydrogenase accessory sulfurtransferase FdhD [Porticoccaceae bacterium]|tara:strand:- start:3830 stop:4642 length:813 start_codon:yes stop_codon:yes gene_type:complete
MTKSIHPDSRVKRQIWLDGEISSGDDQVATETAVALVYNGVSHVVMMATPADLEDFAVGFSLSEGILSSARQLLDVEEKWTGIGVELGLTIAAEAFVGLKERRRNLTGRTGCGLCGAESLEQAIPKPTLITNDLEITHQAIQLAIGQLVDLQSLQKKTGAVHGAAWCNLDGSIAMVREDVGRHNALDKLLGAMARNGFDHDGFVLVTSRASYEMVAKTASANICVLAAVSAPTSLAINLAEQCGLSLIGFSRPGRHVIYSNEQRLVGESQ